MDKRAGKFLKKSPDVIYLKTRPAVHPLSAEQQMFYLKITEGVFSYNEHVRNENFKILATDPNVSFLLPYLSTFIKETIHVNIVVPELTLLIYTVRIAKMLVISPYLDIAPLLHEILPAVLSCVVAKKISKYYYDNHWALRDFSAHVVFLICQRYTTRNNNLTNRVIGIYLKPVKEPFPSLTTLYGATKGLMYLGEEVLRKLFLPHVPNLSKKLQVAYENACNFYTEEKSKKLFKESKNVREALVTAIAPILLKMRNVTDGGMLYTRIYGFLGKYLYAEVKNLEMREMEKNVPMLGKVIHR